MVKKKSKTINDWPLLRLILTIASTVLAVAVVILSTLTMISVYQNDYASAPNYLIWIFLAVGLMSLVLYFKEPTNLNLIRCIVLIIFDVALGIIVLFAKDNPYLFSLTAGLYCITLVISRVFSIIQDHTIRSIIINGLVILFAIALGVGLFTSSNLNPENIQNVILVECVFIAIASFIGAMSVALAQLKVQVLLKIIFNTFALEILLGLLITIVCFSLVFVSIEEKMPTFPDALWYCFAVVTTIGFGDIVAVTPIGRVLTVVLGLYGLVVVGVITSIIVNFYNETAGKHDQKEIKEINKEEQKK